MPVYHFRLTDTETGEFRNVSVAADSKEEAEDVIYRQEMKKVNFQADVVEIKGGMMSPNIIKGAKGTLLTGESRGEALVHFPSIMLQMPEIDRKVPVKYLKKR